MSVKPIVTLIVVGAQAADHQTRDYLRSEAIRIAQERRMAQPTEAEIDVEKKTFVVRGCGRSLSEEVEIDAGYPKGLAVEEEGGVVWLKAIKSLT